MKYFSYIKNFIFPSFCLFCRVSTQKTEIFCLNCHNKIEKPLPQLLPINCNDVMPVYSLSFYDEPMKTLISRLRFDYISCKMIASMMWKQLHIKSLSVDYIIPIPLHWTRYTLRGYNQSEVIAREFSKLSAIPLAISLKRKKRTRYQVTLSKSQRYENLKDAFMYSDNVNIEGKTVILIDDVIASGSTLRFAAQELLKGKPKKIYAYVGCSLHK